MSADPYDAVQDARSDRSEWNEGDTQDDAAQAFRWGYGGDPARLEGADEMSRDECAAASPSRVALAVKGLRCFLGFHRWKMRSVVGRGFSFGEYRWWEVYEECPRCGEERSYAERNSRVAEALRKAVYGS